MDNSIIGFGGKSGGSSSSPTESPDSLHSISYAKMLDLVSEGEIQGLANGLQSIFFDKTPLQNADGSLNYSGVTVDFRPGTQAQQVIAGFPDVENETSVGFPLTSDNPWTQSFSNTQITALGIRLSTSGLSQTNTSNGDITGYSIAFNIQLSTDNGAWTTVISDAFTGKTTSEYDRSYRINLPPSNTGWAVKVVRTTPNAHLATIADAMTVVSTTQIIDAQLSYPMSAIIGTQIDASQFSSIPTRSFDLYGRIIQVPSNYDPIARTYSGVWDGTFKPAWSNNPAWVFYDLVLNDRYGLGNRINSSQVDKWSLYNIGVYCDVSVPNGLGGTEPRMTCNMYLQQQADAYKVLQDLAAVFRGIAYWAGGNIIASADMPADVTYSYAPANVISGDFSYVGSPLKTRYTVALVTYNDPSNFYAQAVETVQDQEGLLRYGIVPTSITAIGCTSRTQAQRIGLWATLTSRLETNTVSFSVGLDGNIAMPGDIIRVLDPNRMGRRNGGRISAVDGLTITVDKIAVVNVGDSFTVNLPTGKSETRTVRAIIGDAVTVSNAFSVSPEPQAIWSVDNTDLFAPTYRVLSVSEKDETTFEIVAIEHQPGKFAYIDAGLPIDILPHSVIPPSVVPPPTNVVLTTYNVLDQGIQNTNMLISWTGSQSATSYIVEWQRDNNNWVTLPETGVTSSEVSGIYAGSYQARVRAKNPLGVLSAPTYSPVTSLTGKTTPPPVVLAFTASSIVFGIKLDWVIPPDATDTQRTEIWYGKTPSLAASVKLSDLAYPQQSYTMMGLSAGASFYFWARLVDNSGNVGDFYPVGNNGVFGQSSVDADDILAYLSGEIGETELSKELLEPIQQIPVIMNQLDNNSDALATSTLKTAIANDLATSTAKTILQAQNAANTALITEEQTARADADSALSAQIITVAAQTGENTASIIQEQQARTDADSALSSDITLVQAQVDGNSAAIVTNATAISNTDGSLSAMYTIKTSITSDGHTYAAGIGVGVDNSTGVIESQVLISADRFAVVNPSGSGVMSPFVIQGGQVFMSQALIGTAWINQANIANAAIGNAQIQTAAISQANIQNAAIGNAQIQDASINNAKIQNAAITNAKIGTAEVDTLTIRGNAVTTPMSGSSTSGDINLVITTTGGVVQILASISSSETSGGDAVPFTVFIKRDGVQATTTAFGIGTLPIISMDYPPPGTHTYTLPVSSIWQYGILTLLEVKR